MHIKHVHVFISTISYQDPTNYSIEHKHKHKLKVTHALVDSTLDANIYAHKHIKTTLTHFRTFLPTDILTHTIKGGNVHTCAPIRTHILQGKL